MNTIILRLCFTLNFGLCFKDLIRNDYDLCSVVVIHSCSLFYEYMYVNEF
jgi:hypothetical protein